MPCLLRIEAVNLANSILDTDDLSTRRGGSLMLLRAVREVEQVFAARMKPVSIGASVGLFEVLEGDLDGLVDAVRRHVTAHRAFTHATFVVAAAQGEFNAAHEQVIAACRWQQMQSPAVRCDFAPATGTGTPPANAICEVDGVRPATVEARFGDRTRSVSSSVHMRRCDDEYGGRAARSDFYRRELANAPAAVGLAVTDDFEVLASAGLTADLVPQNVRDKIAVFYADGNGFGKLQAGCRSITDLRDWDKQLRLKRRGLLAALIERARARPAWQTDQGEVRLETLLWGGDELTWVVPAWCGLELAQFFFDHTAAWRHPQADDGNELTHAAALVFAHRKSPIRGLESLAHSLADECKSARGKQNALAWMVLESFDHAGAELDSFLHRRYPRSAGKPVWNDLLLSPPALRALREHLPAMREVVPRSAMTRALGLLVRGQDEHPLLARSYASVADAVKAEPAAGAKWSTLWQQLTHRDWSAAPAPADIAAWSMLLELWDYAT